MTPEIIAGAVLLICMIMGVGLVFLGLPGTYIMLFGALLYDTITWSSELSAGTIILLVILVAFGELFGLLVRFAENRFASCVVGNTGALIGSAAGGALGAQQGLPGILIGIIVGGAFGALLFETVHYFNVLKASRASIGAFLGSVMGIFVKFEVCIVMLVIIAIGLTV